jgi:mono/diheme cytochrome c family protein
MIKEFFLCSLFLLLVGCGYSDDKSYPPQQPSPSTPQDPGKPLSGQALFASKCASCHGGATPNIGGEDEADIKRALATVGAMKRVVVSDPEIKAIADFLATALTADKSKSEDEDDDGDSEDEGEDD